MPPPIDHRDDISETEMPPHKRLCLSTLGSMYEFEESSTARPTGGRGIDYGDTWVDPAEAVLEIAPITMGEAELLALCEQPRRAGQPGGDARVPNHQDAPRDADSHV
nr:hypothetical protein [Tanacetum cinerariifolium]